MLKSINAYTNRRQDVDWNTCGQAAIATLVDFHGLDPWRLPRTRGRWDDGAAIDAIKADGFGPDIVFGWGSSSGVLTKALWHYGLVARSRGLEPNGGIAQAWPELLNMLDRELPVPVLLDLGRLDGGDFTFHWAIAYAYDSASVHLAAVDTMKRPSHAQFWDAWRCDFVFIPRDLKFGAALSMHPGRSDARHTDKLHGGQALAPGGSIGSSDQRFSLAYLENGSLTLKRNIDGRVLWSTGLRGLLPGHVIMQYDGNLVMYDARVTPAVWASNSSGNPGAALVLQNDGNAVIYRADGTPAWATNTAQPALPSGPQAVGDDMLSGEVLAPGTSLLSADGRFALVYQGDGNLVAYRIRDGAPLWNSHTGGSSPGVAIMQSDGNLVVYDAYGSALWASGTHGQGGGKLVVQNDGNVVIYRLDGSAAWASNTYTWSAVPHSVLHTPDGDTIEIAVDHDAVAQEIVEFVLQLAGRVTWRKMLNLPDGLGSAWDIVAEGVGGSGRNSLWAHQVLNGQRLTLSKAKSFGQMAVVYSLGELSNLVGGDRVTFRWVKDTR